MGYLALARSVLCRSYASLLGEEALCPKRSAELWYCGAPRVCDAALAALSKGHHPFGCQSSDGSGGGPPCSSAVVKVVPDLPDSMILHVLLATEQDHAVAHCLEMDIVAEGATVAAVLEEMEALIRTAVEYAVANDNLAHLFVPAPQEYWGQLSRAKRLPGERKIVIEVPARDDDGFPYTSLEVEGLSAPGALCRA